MIHCSHSGENLTTLDFVHIDQYFSEHRVVLRGLTVKTDCVFPVSNICESVCNKNINSGFNRMRILYPDDEKRGRSRNCIQLIEMSCKILLTVHLKVKCPHA